MAQKRKSGAPAGAAARGERTSVVVNRRARHEFEVLESFDCGIVLRGTEVKVLREGRVSLDEAFGRVQDDELFLVGAHIDVYRHASIHNHEPTRRRKLLLKRLEIRKVKAKVTQKGLTLVPLEIYFSERGLAKVVLGLCRGRKIHDKREEIKRREARREMRV